VVTRLLRGLPVPLALIGMLAVAGLALGRIYAGPLIVQLMLGAAIGSVATSVAARRLPSWAVGPLSVLGLTGYTLLAVKVAAASSGVPGTLPALTADALANGIPRVLTAMIPVEAQPDTVVVPVLATWLAGLAGAEIALRTGRALLACVPAGLLYGTVLYAVGPNAPGALWQPLCFAALVAAALATSAAERTTSTDERPTSTDERPTSTDEKSTAALRARVAAGAAAGLAVTLALAAVVGPVLAAQVGTHPADPRRYVKPPQLDALDENPLVRLSGWALAPDQHLFDVRLSGRAGNDMRIRLAVLNDYDGVTWRVGATYRTAGRVLTGPAGATGENGAAGGDGPAGGGRAGGGKPVTQRITIADLDGRLVPAIATPQRIEGARVAYDQASGTIAIPEGLHAGLAYDVESRRAALDVNLLPTAEVPSGGPTTRFIRLGSQPPDQIRRLSQQLSEGSGSPYQRAQAIEQFLAEHYQLVADAPSGHAYPNLAFFLFGPPAGGGQRGTSEQFAAAFGVLARSMGLPTRIVVGFRVKPGTTTVRGADALAWPEVQFSGVGWVPFNPLPQPDAKPRPVEEDFKPSPEPSTPPPTNTPPPAASTSATPKPPAAGTGDGGPGAGTVAAATGSGLFLVLVAAVAAVVLLRRTRRRRRLYAGDPAGRIVGAWREVLDALRLAGRPPPAHLAATEVADHAARAVGHRHAEHPPGHRHVEHHAGHPNVVRPAAPVLDDLAGLVNVVTFAPDGVGEAQADRAAAQASAYVDELRARRSWWRRLLWSADPRPLRWRP
jgi:hypothetical protein